MRKMSYVVLAFFALAILGHGVSWAEYDDGGSSLDSSDLEEGRDEIQEMGSSMDVQPGDAVDSLEEKGMDVQSGDSFDSEGMGAH